MRLRLKLRKIACAVCAGICLLVLFTFCLQVGKGIGRVRRGEATPARVIEDTLDWLVGKEEGSPG